jgi:hypothetical protein
MVEWNPNFPNNEQYQKYEKLFPGNKLRHDIRQISPDLKGIEIVLGRDISEWRHVLYNKIFHIDVAYTSSFFYYENGFFDHGDPISNMAIEDLIRKSMFIFFSDTFFYQLSSAFDIIGQLLNKRYALDLDERKRYFDRAVCPKLKTANESIYKKLDEIKRSQKYQSVKIRNNIAHDIPPSESVGFYLKFSGNQGALQTNKYMTAKEIKGKMQNALDCLGDTIRVLKEI